MAREQSQRVAELEALVVGFQQREKRLRAVLSSGFTSRESRRDARVELESLLNTSEDVEDELLLLESPGGRSPEKLGKTSAFVLPPIKATLRRRFERAGEIRRSGLDRSGHLRSSEHRSAFSQ